ncbi:cardiolipin synthase [Texcoconibacillus texcoconensis]|uniref:Cardiolipin synthase n=1 Tax=Texcoconibacillus texcoconensis TaxID=1095777 RepID=A0A840QN21_9BACI|nr:cardiolipin synthase [Texcoconibacillus texcoconensis]MBB5172766.1 cardiolipin synthase [Texcoconibacillus texcoconensis]
MELTNISTWVLSMIPIINILLACVVVFIERRDIGHTWAWLMVLFFIPLLGFIFYIFLGRRINQKNFYKLTDEEQDYLQSSVDKQLEKLKDPSYRQKHLFEKYLGLIRMNLKSPNALVSTDNEVEIFNDGHRKFAALFDDIRAAEKEINIQYYIIQRDSLTEKLRDELTKKAKQGVKVRILYDEIGSRKISPSYFKEMVAHGGEVAVFFPSFLKLINFRINNRNHRKLCIIDGEVGYIGGFNVGEEYLGHDEKFGYWRDTHLRVRGGAVDQIQGRFILDWHYATKQQQLNSEQFSFRTKNHDGQSSAQVLASGPNSETEYIKNMYIKLMMSAKKNVYIQTPYFIPDASFMDACKVALLSGVDVHIMIPNKPDHPFVYWATWSYVGELLKYGAKILIYENGFMHAKAIVVDGEVASVGTTNIDNRSFKLNFEVNTLLYDQQVAADLHEMFLEDREVCSELTLERYQKRPLFIKFKEAISRLLSPIL